MKIVVVGGGFGGLKAAIELAKRNVGSITLISDKNYFLHHGTLYATATGRNPHESAVPLKEILDAHPAVTFRHDTVMTIDGDARIVHGKKRQYRYDALIVSLGMVDQFTGKNYRQNYSYALSSLEAAQAFQAAFHEAMIADTAVAIRCAIIGGGMAGVELAGALSEYATRITHAHTLRRAKVEVMIVEAGDRVLSNMSEAARRKITKRLRQNDVKITTKTTIGTVRDGGVVLGDERVKVDMVMWTCGGKMPQLFAEHKHLFKLSKRGRVIVNQYMMAYPGIYVIGDNAETERSGLAATALEDAKFVATHMYRKQAHRPLKPRVRRRHYLITIPITRFWAYAEYAGVYAAGLSGSAVRRLAELNNYCAFLPLGKAYTLWRKHRESVENCRLCQKVH